MKIRRFYSHNVRSALKQVNEIFGDDAAILSNKKVPGGVEIIAALDYDEALLEQQLKKSNANSDASLNNNPSTGEQKKPAEQMAAAVTSPANQQQRQANQHTAPSLQQRLSGEGKTIPNADFINANIPQQTPLSDNIAKITPLSAEFNPDPDKHSGQYSSGEEDILEGFSGYEALEVSANKPKASKNDKLEWYLDPGLQAMKEELGMLRSMMSEQLKGIAWDRYKEKDPLTAMILRRLAKLGINSQVSNLLLPHIESSSKQSASKDIAAYWQKTLAILARSIPVAEETLMKNGGVFAFIGPTGVGKTTTLAKLAARFVIRHGSDSVALISMDEQRISAQDQIATFGRILKVSTARVTEKQPLESLLKKFADKKLVLIDTAGVSSADSEMLKPLNNISSGYRPVSKLLLVSATSQAGVMQQSLKRFSAYAPTALVFTKLDEATSLGDILSVAIKGDIPVVYTTDGQRIPEDIRAAQSQHIISKAVHLANQYSLDTDEWHLAQGLNSAKSA